MTADRNVFFVHADDNGRTESYTIYGALSVSVEKRSGVGHCLNAGFPVGLIKNESV